MTAPEARRGSDTRETGVILMPNDFPPTSGTQSGTSKWILFKAEIKRLIPSMMKLIAPSTVPTMRFQTPFRISRTPFHAFFQSPVNTPVRKVIRPLRIFFHALYWSENIFPIVSKIAASAGFLPCSHVINALHASLMEFTIAFHVCLSPAQICFAPSAASFRSPVNTPLKNFPNPSMIFFSP